MSTPRVPPLDPTTAKASPETVATILQRRGGKLTALDQLLVHSDPVARGWSELFSGLATKVTLDARIREIAILRVCHLTQARFESFHHRRLALQAGMTQAEVDAVASWQDSDQFSPRERAVLAYVDTMTQQVHVPDAVFDALRPHFDERQLVELTTSIAAYNMVVRLTEALNLLP